MVLTSPLEIQEIADLVATFLEGKDLASCVRVSKGWQDTFLPHRWRVIRVGFTMETWSDIRFGPDRHDTYTHRHLIQDLSLVNEIAGLDKYHYQNLRRLMIHNIDLHPAYRLVSTDLITMGPLLVDLELHGVDAPPAFWEALSTHPHVRNMTLQQIKLKADDTPVFWRACMRMESLRMHHVNTRDGGRPKNVVFNRLRKLVMTGTDSSRHYPYHSDLILQSPMLKSLEMSIPFLPLVKDELLNSHWPPLTKLHISSYLQDTEVASILNRVGNGRGSIADLRLYRCDMRTQASSALSLLFGTLVYVSLGRQCSSSSTILDVLCGCPRLEILLTVGSVLAGDIAGRGPWICQQLRELKIWFRFEESEQNLHQLVFERLSTLVRLEQLTIEHPLISHTGHKEGLVFRFDFGLERLASLQQLTDLSFGPGRVRGRFPQLGMGKAAWMVDNWKKLKRIKGCLNSNNEIRARLVGAFESHGISVQCICDRASSTVQP